MSKVTFNSSNSPFFRSLKQKVDGYFKDNNISPTGTPAIFIQSFFHIAFFVFAYVTLVFFTPPVYLALPLAALFGANLAFIGFVIMHGGSHGNFSDRKWLNTAGAYTLNMMGGIAYFWKIKHNVNHHTFTNIDGFDSDIDQKPFLRLHEHQPLKGHHRFQHLYFVLLYGLTYLSWVLFDDFDKYFSGHIAHNAKPISGTKEIAIFWMTKVFFFSMYMVVPIVMVGFLPFLAGFLLAGFTCGATLGVVFQLAHVMDDTEFPLPEGEQGRIDEEWAVHQIKTTVNFGTESKMLTGLLGGLNYQVEHHLFPRISHAHYPAVSRIVKENCAEFGVQYNEYPTMWSAVKAHKKYLRRMGQKEQVLVTA